MEIVDLTCENKDFIDTCVQENGINDLSQDIHSEVGWILQHPCVQLCLWYCFDNCWKFDRYLVEEVKPDGHVDKTYNDCCPQRSFTVEGNFCLGKWCNYIACVCLLLVHSNFDCSVLNFPKQCACQRSFSKFQRAFPFNSFGVWQLDRGSSQLDSKTWSSPWCHPCLQQWQVEALWLLGVPFGGGPKWRANLE